MDTQLRAVVVDLQKAEERLHSLRSTLPREAWTHRPGDRRWSPAECVAHLNLTSEAVLPLLRAGLTEARCRVRHVPTCHRRDPVGWMLWMATAPWCRVKTRTVPALMPPGERPLAALVADFAALQADVIECVEGRRVEANDARTCLA
ncbi:MAG TPA: DinB family protein [Vicinamibacterales bacterium]|nr:DinB family protein [Vicinamibacterales bacterium]